MQALKPAFFFAGTSLPNFAGNDKMAINEATYRQLMLELPQEVTLVAVSKTKSAQDILDLYNMGHKDFGENYVQELTEKYAQLPNDIRWHFIGHLQSNKVKFIAAFVHLIHGVDRFPLLKEINKQAAKNNRNIDLLLQVHIASEETKFGFDDAELGALPPLHDFKNIRVRGLMGMASFTNNMQQVQKEFEHLKTIFDKMRPSHPFFDTLSMGMSSDYKTAIQAGSSMVRIGSMLFGSRN